ncbi:hypothetical protein [Niallia sp. NCCP-28]|uniref:hypothetical protein n=1 Tax=Niallia sp. NCCP-28 TaxID=2934712 RepID=UPI0020870CC6|nr:hypothetical protein [Niallia sp. NCCP-28]GKU85317.1 hypothetical protein NCCP28_47130 [Niallia sp. NCCP-28]
MKHKGKLVAVRMNTGEKLVGYLVDPIRDGFPVPKRDGGMWLARKTHLTWLSDDGVEEVRLAKDGEEEIDYRVRN